MRETTTANTGGAVTTIVLFIVVSVVAFMALTGRRFLWLTGDRAALVTLAILGMAMCARGIGRVAAIGAWTHPLAIGAYILGAAILVITVWFAAGRSLPWLADARAALIAVVTLMAAKFVLSAIHSFLR